MYKQYTMRWLPSSTLLVYRVKFGLTLFLGSLLKSPQLLLQIQWLLVLAALFAFHPYLDVPVDDVHVVQCLQTRQRLRPAPGFRPIKRIPVESMPHHEQCHDT